MTATIYPAVYGPEAIENDLGQPLVRVPVTIFTVNTAMVKTSTQATLYQTLDRSVALSNPLPQDVADGQFGLDQHGNVTILLDLDIYWMEWTSSAVTHGKLIFPQPVGREPQAYGGDWVTSRFWPAGALVNVPGTPSTMWLARRDVAPSTVSPVAGADWAAVPPAGPKGDPGGGPDDDQVAAAVAAWFVAHPVTAEAVWAD